MQITVQKLNYSFINDEFLKTLESLRPTGLTVEEAREVFTQEYLQLNHVYIALVEGVVVGTATLVLERKFIHKGGMVGHIEDVSVNEDYKQEGVGTTLINRLIDIGKTMMCYKLILDCNKDIIPFYSQFGFYQTEEANLRLDLT